MTPDQVKAARLLLGWSMSRLGMRSGTSMHTVRIFERSGQVAKLYCRTDQVDAVAAIRDTLRAVQRFRMTVSESRFLMPARPAR